MATKTPRDANVIKLSEVTLRIKVVDFVCDIMNLKKVDHLSS